MPNEFIARNGLISLGNVGIGTTSPQVELHVKGTNGWGELRLEGQSFSGGNGGVVEFYSEGTALADIYSDTTKNLIFRTNGSTERMRITSSGNVGIGTTSPTTNLSITNGATMYALQEGALLDIKRNASNGNDTTSRSGLRLGNNSNAFSIFYGGSTDRLRFIDGGGVEVMSMVNGGSIGIGTTSPLSRLHIETTASNPLRMVRSGESTSFGFEFGGGDIGLYNYTNTNYVWYAKASGNVGIGTTSPVARLHVGESGAAAQLWLQRTDGYNPVKLIGGTLSDGNGFKITMNTTDAFAITSGGNVGIGTTSPSERLTVSGNVLATAFFASSDITLKNIIKTSYNPTGIEAISYKWKDSGIDTKVHIGYSAQQVQEFMPDAVSKDSNGKLSVNYVEVLVAKIAALEAKVKQLEAK